MFRNSVKGPVLTMVLYLSLMTNAEELSRTCPPQESLYSCTCKQLEKGPEITCIKISDNLDEIFSALRGYAIERLNLVDGEFDSVLPDQWRGLHIKDLSISGVDIKQGLDPELRYFQGLENSVRILHISKSFKSKPVVTMRTDHLRHLEVLIMEDNAILEINKDWFGEEQLSLKTVIFERNNVKSVGKEAFASLKNLKTFALAGNSLTSLPRSILPQPANHLQTIDLAYNRIKEFPENAFSGMPALQTLNLDHNAIVTLPEKVISPIWNQLSEFNFLGNPLRCDSEIKWICSSKRIDIKAKCQDPPEEAGKNIMAICPSFNYDAEK